MSGFEIEPNLENAEPGRRLYDGGDPNRQAADAISVEQRALSIQLRRELVGQVADFADKIIAGLSPEIVFEDFSFTQADAIGTGADAAPGGRLLQLQNLTRGGVWRIVGVLALGHPSNTADLIVTLNDLVPGFPIQITAPRQNPSERTLNVPARGLGGSFGAVVAGGAAGDRVQLRFRLERYGAQLGAGGRI